MNNFWKKLKRPFFVLAPMADVTDFVQRQMLAKYGKPDVTYTEFVSVDGLVSEKGRIHFEKELHYEGNERPIVAQIFGSKPENIRKAVEIVEEMGFDGADINMGCPDKAVIKQGAGSALIRNPELAREIIRSAKEGAKKIPVSVKTRIGFNKEEIETWIAGILQEKPDALTVHLRTKKELSEVGAHWELMEKIVARAKKQDVVIIGNGDVASLEEGREKAEKTGADGIMIGRGIFGKPWFFNDEKKDFSIEEKLNLMLEHTKLFEKELSQKNIKSFHIMKKHFKAYCSGFEGAKELRAKLMESENSCEVEKVVRDFLREDVL